MNRQQRRLIERNREKEVNKKIKSLANNILNNSKSKYDIDKANAIKWVLTLKDEQAKYVNLLINAASQKDLNDMSYAYDITLKNWLYEHNFDVDKEIKEIFETMRLENKYVNEFKEGSYFMNLDKDRENIVIDYKKMKEENMRESQILDNLCIKYCKYSKNAIKSVITDFKKNKKNVQKDVQAEPDIEAITDYIFGDEEKTVKSNNTTSKNKNTKLKVKSIVVEDEEGREYIKEGEIVKVGSETFKSVDELEKYKSNELEEYKKGYEEKIAEINKAYEDEKIAFLKKINNIADVFMM